jgi:rubrerythrin
METKTHLGHNRTGVQMSPIDAAAMLRDADEIADSIEPIEGNGRMRDADGRGHLADAQLRESYAVEADAIGSVPVPATLTGVAASGLDMIKGNRPQVLMDKLGERLAFERGGVRLYDALLVKCRAQGEGLEAGELELLQRFRDEEAQHLELVADAMEALGGDPSAQTPGADSVGVRAMGLVQAMNDPRTTLVQSLSVMLDAELIDNAAWDLLIRLASRAGHEPIAERFGVALQQESEHLVTLNALVSRLTLVDAGHGQSNGKAKASPKVSPKASAKASPKTSPKTSPKARTKA